MTAIEVTHSLTSTELSKLVDTISPAIPTIASYTQSHRARVIRPMIGYDAQAIALGFVPAAGESLPHGRSVEEDAYTYHHLRRDLFGLIEKAGVQLNQRYVVPSSHLTIGRFITPADHSLEGSETTDPEKMQEWIKKIEEINAWLKDEYWPKEGNEAIKPGGEWIVGEEKGLDCRRGTLWYGGGETIFLGPGF
jgi:vesicle-fusing ATPase